jgi:hypothetical protein
LVPILKAAFVRGLAFAVDFAAIGEALVLVEVTCAVRTTFTVIESLKLESKFARPNGEMDDLDIVGVKEDFFELPMLSSRVQTFEAEVGGKRLIRDET